MSDYISRQAAIDALYAQSDDDGWWCGTAQDAEELLKGLPSADVPNCDECKYKKTIEEQIRISELCKHIKRAPLPEGSVFE